MPICSLPSIFFRLCDGFSDGTRPFHHVDDHTPLYPVYHRRMHEERQTAYHLADYPALCIYSGRIAQQWSEDLPCRPFTNGRKFFSIKYFLIGIILPAALMWGFARWEYRTFVWPKEMARHEAKMKKTRKPQPRFTSNTATALA